MGDVARRGSLIYRRQKAAESKTKKCKFFGTELFQHNKIDPVVTNVQFFFFEENQKIKLKKLAIKCVSEKNIKFT